MSERDRCSVSATGSRVGLLKGRSAARARMARVIVAPDAFRSLLVPLAVTAAFCSPLTCGHSNRRSRFSSGLAPHRLSPVSALLCLHDTASLLSSTVIAPHRLVSMLARHRFSLSSTVIAPHRLVSMLARHRFSPLLDCGLHPIGSFLCLHDIFPSLSLGLFSSLSLSHTLTSSSACVPLSRGPKTSVISASLSRAMLSSSA